MMKTKMQTCFSTYAHQAHLVLIHHDILITMEMIPLNISMDIHMEVVGIIQKPYFHPPVLRII